MNKPRGHTAFGVFLIFGAVMAVYAGITLFLPGTLLDKLWVVNPVGHQKLLALGRFVGLGFFILCVFLAISAFGWLTKRRWGWWCAISIIIFQGLGSIARFFTGDILQGIMGAAVVGLLIYYLLSSSVRFYFTSEIEEETKSPA